MMIYQDQGENSIIIAHANYDKYGLMGISVTGRSSFTTDNFRRSQISMEHYLENMILYSPFAI
mgnify:CR=1 FL=1